MKRTKFLVIVVTLVALLSLLSVVDSIHPAFAQDASFGATAKNSGSGTTNNGATGAQSSNQEQTDSISIRLSPNQGPPGTAFTVYGSLSPKYVLVYVSSDLAPTEQVHILPSGLFTTEIIVPGNANPGTYSVKVSTANFVLPPSKNHPGTVYQLSQEATFTVTGQVSNTVGAKTGPHQNPPPPPPPPNQPTNSATGGGGGSSLPHITINPTSGFPGTEVKITGGNFEGTATLSAGGKTVAKSSDVGGFGDHISVASDGSLVGQVTIPPDAQPGPFPIQVDSSGPTVRATFDVLKEPTFVETKTTPVFKDSSNPPDQPTIKQSITSGKTGTSAAKSNVYKKLTLGTGTVTSSSTTNSGSSNQPQSIPKPISKRGDQNGNPVDSGASFSVFKTVVGGDAIPDEFMYNLILTGPSGTAQYPIGPTLGQGNPAETLPFNLDLPKGNTLSEGTFQIVETNPGDYTPSYGKGCSGSYDNDGYWYTCAITNTKKVIPNTTTSIVNGGPLPPQPGIKTNEKTTLPTASNNGKLTLPTIPHKSTEITTHGKSTETITKPSTVHQCPAGSTVANGQCVVKGKIVGTLQ